MEELKKKDIENVDYLVRNNPHMSDETRDSLKKFLSFLSRYIAISESGKWMKEKEVLETCTKCGGLGKIPNHPHIPARVCDKCNGARKIIREDYKLYNQMRQDMLMAFMKRCEGLEKVIEENQDLCSRCEGNGKLWADGQSHFHHYEGRTILCGECGGSGYIQGGNLAQALTKFLTGDRE